MSLNKEEEFNKILSGALKRHSGPVPAAFTERVSNRIRELEEERILTRVVMEERLALAGCIVLSIIAIVSLLAFPNITAGFKELILVSTRRVILAVEITNYKWYLYTAFAGIFGFAVYRLMDLLVSDTWR